MRSVLGLRRCHGSRAQGGVGPGADDIVPEFGGRGGSESAMEPEPPHKDLLADGLCHLDHLGRLINQPEALSPGSLGR